MQVWVFFIMTKYIHLVTDKERAAQSEKKFEDEESASQTAGRERLDAFEAKIEGYITQLRELQRLEKASEGLHASSVTSIITEAMAEGGSIRAAVYGADQALTDETTLEVIKRALDSLTGLLEVSKTVVSETSGGEDRSSLLKRDEVERIVNEAARSLRGKLDNVDGAKIKLEFEVLGDEEFFDQNAITGFMNESVRIFTKGVLVRLKPTQAADQSLTYTVTYRESLNPSQVLAGVLEAGTDYYSMDSLVNLSEVIEDVVVEEGGVVISDLRAITERSTTVNRKK